MAKFSNITEEQWVTWLTLFSSSLLVVSLIFSPFLLSVSMWLLVAAGLWQVSASCGERRFFNILKIALQNYWHNKVLLVLGSLFLLPLLSGFWSSDLSFWLERVRVRIPFVVLPFAFANLPKFCAVQRRVFWYVFLGVVAGTSVGVLVNFSLNFEKIMQMLREGQAMPVPRGNHIRFSLMVGWATVAAAWLAMQDFAAKRKGQNNLSPHEQSTLSGWQLPRTPYFLSFLVVFLFIVQHILAVRSGLFAIYLVLFFVIFKLIFFERKWFLSTSILGILIVGGWVAVQKLPSLAQKISYMQWDWQQTDTETGSQYSDSGRKISMLAGWELVKKHPLFGVGAGDLPQEMQKTVVEHYPHHAQAVKLPHNQFLYWWVSTGFLGLLASFWAVFLPLFFKKYRQNVLFQLFQIIIFASFLAEYTLETAVGVAFFLFFQLILIKNEIEPFQ